MTNQGFNISIIIPTHNRAGEIGKAVKSVLQQTNPNWELIIVDDGSVDNTSEVINEYLADERIKYIWQENQGVSSARNSGAKIAGGSYLIFLDSDDVFFPELINTLYQNHFWNNDLIFWQVLKRINGKLSLWKPFNLGRMFNNLEATFLAGSVCFRKEIFEEAGGYDPLMTFGENYELGLRISQIPNLKIKYIKEPFLKYSINTTNRTSNSLSNRLNSHLHQFHKHKEKYKRDRKASSTINYLIGFIYEKTHKRSTALQYYRDSWYNAPLNFKPALKVLYLNIFK